MQSLMKKTALCGGAVFLFFAAFYVALRVDRFVGELADRSPLAGMANPAPGKRLAPDANALFTASLKGLDGQQQELRQWRGQVLVVNFWATWCPPCRQEIPLFKETVRRHAGQGLVVIGIALDRKDRVGRYARDVHINYPILLAGNSGAALAATLGNDTGAVPYTVIVDPDGRVVHTHPGIYTQALLEKEIAPLLAGMKQPAASRVSAYKEL